MSGHGFERNGSPPTISGTPSPWRPAFPKAGRSSLSALDSQHADAIRREAFASIYTSSPAAFTSFNNKSPQVVSGREDTGSEPIPREDIPRQPPARRNRGVSGDSNNNSKPPVSMLSGGTDRLRRHQRRYSASAAVHSSNSPETKPTYSLSTNAHQLQHQRRHTPPARLLRVPTRFTAPKTSVDMAAVAQYPPWANSLGSGPVPNGPLHTQEQQQYSLAHPQQQQSTADFVMRTQRASVRAKQDGPTGTNPHVDPASPLVDDQMPPPTLRQPPNVPRRLSSGSTTSNITAVTALTSRESFESRRAPLSSRTSFESAVPSPYDSPRQSPSTGWTTPMTSPLGSPRWDGAPGGYSPDMITAMRPRNSWEASQMQMQPGYSWHRPALLKRRQPRKQGELFAMLPGEVLELIMEELKQGHLAPGSGSCATCWMRDACNVAISCRKWHKYARAALYEDVQLVGAENGFWKKKYKLTDGARLTLLRRTLRTRPQIAAIVHSLKVPAQPAGLGLESYHNLVASVVMSCPNLERLVGFYPSYNGTFNRLFHALSSRQRLKQMDWIVEPSPVQRHTRSRSASSANLANMLAKRGGTSPNTAGIEMKNSSFLEYNSNWTYLNSLSIHCQPGSTLPVDTLHASTFSRLPALQHLYLSNFPPSLCNDATLMHLPPLKTLSLSNLPGITSMGLSSFVAKSSGQPITTLTLKNVDLVSLPVLARIFSNLPKLRTLNIVQALPPIRPKDEVIWLFPYLASKTLHTLHWDITSAKQTSPASEADHILAKSIAANGFPSLRVIRAPNDGDGVFQSLCRPRDRIDLPTDKFRLPGQGGYGSRPSLSSDGTHPFGGSRPSMGSSNSAGSLKKSNTGSSTSSSTSATSSSPTSPINDAAARGRSGGSDLIAARLAAQSRIEAAYRVPRFFVNVVDEDGSVNEKFGIGGHIGTVRSKIRYHLLPDPGANDENGGLVEVADMLSSCGEDISAGPDGCAPEGCTGKWNTWSGSLMTADRKEREKWYHTERGRWRGVKLS